MDPVIPAFLRQVPLFGALSADACVQLEGRMRRCDFVPQSLIVREGSADDSAFDDVRRAI